MTPYSMNEMEAYIRRAAMARGIDPEIALKVARSEGLRPGTWQSDVMKGGVREPSYGPYQLYKGGGLGNEFQKATGLDPADPSTAYKGVDFALDTAAKGGWKPWYGAKAANIAPMQGIGQRQPSGGPGLPNIPPIGLMQAGKAVTQAIPDVAEAARNFKVPSSAQLTAAKYLPAGLTGANKIRDALSQGISTAQGMFKPPQAAPQPPMNLAGIGPPPPGIKPPMGGMAGLGGIFGNALSGLAQGMMQPRQQQPQQTNFTTGVPVQPPRQPPMGPPPNNNRGLELVKILMARDPRMAESVMQLLMKGA